MLLKDVRDHFVYMARCMKHCNFSENAYREWVKRGYIPISSQIKVELATKGVLEANLSHIEPFLSFDVEFKRVKSDIDYDKAAGIDFTNKTKGQRFTKIVDLLTK